MILEPVLQGAGGMHVYSPHAVRFLAALAREHGALVIFDEIATGFWRTGSGLGHRPLWSDARHPLCRQGADRRLSLARRRACHGRGRETGGCQPGGCHDARPDLHGEPVGVLGGLRQPRPARHVTTTRPGSPRSRPGWSPASPRLASSRPVRDVRVLGAVGVVELDRPVDVAAVTRVALEHGVWVRPFRNLVYTMPPYISTDDDIAAITSAIVAAVKKVHG